MVALKSLFVAFALGAQALAASNTVVCSTNLGPESVKSVPTSTGTSVTKITVVKKVIRKVNIIVIPVAKTSTIKTTSTVTSTTTAGPATKTATSTITSESTILSTRIGTTITTSTSTSTIITHLTSTATTPTSFTAIRDDPLYIAKRDAKKLVKLETFAAVNFPQSVSCDKKIYSTSVKTDSTTVQGARITLKATAKTTMVTVTTTETSTEYPSDLSITVTETVRPTVTDFTDTLSTSTVTQTVTVQTQIADVIIYDICKNNNIISSANNEGNIIGYYDLDLSYNAVSIGPGYTAEACCAACAQRSDCGLSMVQSTNRQCVIYVAPNMNTCANGAQPLVARYITSGDSSSVVYWSNGPCGQAKNGGDISAFPTFK